MSGNTFGQLFKITTFGESHGTALGCVIDGCPAGIPISISRIQSALDKRKPGAIQVDANGKRIVNTAVTTRKEADKAELVSGVFFDSDALPPELPLSTGTPISILIYNTSQRSKDYTSLQDVFRPGHADYTYAQKYGVRDYYGGGRSSGRETAARVAAGAVAQMVLESFCNKTEHIPTITAWTQEAAGICAPDDFSPNNSRDISLLRIQTLQTAINSNPMRTTDSISAKKMEDAIENCKHNKDSAGGIIRCLITGIPAGLGEPVFDKLDAELAKAILSIGAVKGIEFGSGFKSAQMHGSEWNDSMAVEQEHKPFFTTNHSGGILGGLSTGAPILFDVAVKPVPSIRKTQKTIKKNKSTNTFENTCISIEGRHDVCLCPRIIPVVEAMATIVLADMLLRNYTARR